MSTDLAGGVKLGYRVYALCKLITVGSDSIVVNTITDSETMLIIMIFPLGVIKTNLYAHQCHSCM